MALKNTRIGTDQRFALSLSNAGAKVNMNDVEVLHLCMYSDDQRSNDGSIGYAVNTDDATVLDLLWLAKSQSYLGEHSVHGTIRYSGTVASFDVPAVNVVSRTSEADISTETIVLEAPVGTEDLTATITIQGMGPQGPKGDKMTYADLTQEEKKDLYEGASEVMKPLLATKQNTLTDTDGSYGQRVAELEKGKQDTLTAGNGISIEGNVISAIGGGGGDIDSLITPITYAELVALRDSSSLVPGMQYRITDYACTTTQENTQSAGHPFDIIVIADSENTLNEKARAIQHEGDTYFADCNLSAWKIWYCLDNDNTRFAWADSVNGKGVIYWMIDEFNNDVPYDFKNIQFARDLAVIAPDSGLTGTTYCYTFSVFLDGFSEGVTADDESIKVKECIESDGEGHFGNNVIKPYQNLGIYSLNDIVFYTDWGNYSVNHYNNTFGSNCFSITFGSDCYSNTFGNECYNNTFGDDCYNNTFGNECYNNTFGNYCYSNTFGNECYNNTFGNNCYKNTFGDNCYNNTFGNYCNKIKLATLNSATTKYNYYSHNHFGDGCQYILFKGAETASSSAQVQNYNFAQGLQGTSSAYLTIDGVRSRAYETKVAMNSSGELKIYCEADLIQ